MRVKKFDGLQRASIQRSGAFDIYTVSMDGDEEIIAVKSKRRRRPAQNMTQAR